MSERNNRSKIDSEPKEQELPEIRVVIVFGQHGTAQDLDLTGLRNHFIEADVYIMEAVAWTPELYQFINELSQGEKQPNDVFQLGSRENSSAEHVMAELEMIQNSGKPVGFIDIPYKTHPAVDHFVETVKAGNMLSQLIKPDFSVTLEQLRQWVKNFSQLSRDRELHMVEIFPEVIRQILNEHPSLKERKDLLVLIGLGSAHTPVAEALEKRGYEITTTIYKPYPEADPKDRAIQQQQDNGFVDDDLLAKAVISILIRAIFKNEIASLSDDSEKISVFLGIVTDFLSYNEVKDLYPRIWQITNLEELKMLFLNLFASRGLDFPPNEEELDTLIAKTNITS